jgi:hypothetical protein
MCASGEMQRQLYPYYPPGEKAVTKKAGFIGQTAA